MNPKLQFGAEDRKRDFFAFGNVTKLFWKACFVSAQMQKWKRAHPYDCHFSACTLRCTQTVSPDSQETFKCTFCQEKTTGFPCFWLKHCTLQDQIPEKQHERKLVLTRRTVSKLLGFQDKAESSQGLVVS